MTTFYPDKYNAILMAITQEYAVDDVDFALVPNKTPSFDDGEAEAADDGNHDRYAIFRDQASAAISFDELDVADHLSGKVEIAPPSSTGTIEMLWKDPSLSDDASSTATPPKILGKNGNVPTARDIAASIASLPSLEKKQILTSPALAKNTARSPARDRASSTVSSSMQEAAQPVVNGRTLKVVGIPNSRRKKKYLKDEPDLHLYKLRHDWVIEAIGNAKGRKTKCPELTVETVGTATIDAPTDTWDLKRSVMETRMNANQHVDIMLHAAAAGRKRLAQLHGKSEDEPQDVPCDKTTSARKLSRQESFSIRSSTPTIHTVLAPKRKSSLPIGSSVHSNLQRSHTLAPTKSGRSPALKKLSQEVCGPNSLMSEMLQKSMERQARQKKDDAHHTTMASDQTEEAKVVMAPPTRSRSLMPHRDFAKGGGAAATEPGTERRGMLKRALSRKFSSRKVTMAEF
ncbi:MAG: hypothetical protein SGILL_001781 [Bacillariaceae sp.]